MVKCSGYERLTMLHICQGFSGLAFVVGKCYSGHRAVVYHHLLSNADNRLMFINSEELKRRQKEQHNLMKRLKVPPAEPSEGPELDTSKFKKDGTTTGKPVFTEGLRAIIGATAAVVGGKETAEIFNVSASYANALARGDANLGEESQERLRAAIYEELGNIRDSARKKLEIALGLVTKESLEAIPDSRRAEVATKIANQLMGVIDKTIMKQGNLTDARQAHLHLYSPETRPVEAFNIKTINVIPEVSESASD